MWQLHVQAVRTWIQGTRITCNQLWSVTRHLVHLWGVLPIEDNAGCSRFVHKDTCRSIFARGTFVHDVLLLHVPSSLATCFYSHTARHESGHVTVQACSGSDACNYVYVLVSLQGSKYATCVFFLSTRSLPFPPEWLVWSMYWLRHIPVQGLRLSCTGWFTTPNYSLPN